LVPVRGEPRGCRQFAAVSAACEQRAAGQVAAVFCL
jgi:hypothetical protein